jgi:hypothetical protein
MTESSVYLTSNAQAARAVEIAAAKKAALREADARSAERRGEVKQVRKLDGLALLHKAGELTDDMHRVGLAYQRAYEACAGLRGRNALNDTPPGDRDTALQATIEAGRLIVKCERCCVTAGELNALRSIVGLGHSVRSQASGRRYREMCDLVVGVLGKMAEARL